MSNLQRLWPLAMIAVLIAMFLASYCGAYFVMQRSATQRGRGLRGVLIVRRYSADWQVVLFRPAAKVESVLLKRKVYLEFEP